MKLKTVLTQGLWGSTSAWGQQLGLCPLLAVSTNTLQALGLGLATTGVLITTNCIISVIRRFIPRQIRIPIYVMIIASMTTSMQLVLQAWSEQLYQALGIFIPLIITNCIIIGRAEAFASQNPPHLAAGDGLAVGLSITCILCVLGSIRELLATGCLLQRSAHLLGEWAKGLEWSLFPLEKPFLLAILPPGAFLILGFLLALKQKITYNHRQSQRKYTALQIPITTLEVEQ